jgi:PAS domain S-box-containing protein
LLEALQSTAAVGFGFVDRDCHYLRVNETLASINGLSVEQHLGRTVAEVGPAVWHRIEPVYRRVLGGGQAVIDLEMTGVTATAPGELRHWLVTMYPVRIDAEITGAGVVVVDVTERRQAEEFRSVVMDNMAEGLFTLDRDGLLTYMNRAAVKMLGWTESELRGQPMHAAVHFQRADGTPVAAHECSVAKVGSEGLAVRQAGEAFTRKDGSIFPVAHSSAPLRVGSSIQGTVVVFRDVTEEKEDQARVQRELAALSWVGRVRDALDEHRMVLYSQPIVALAGGQGGEELLLRMVGRGGEIILPASFLPVAEKYGLIAEIDRWVTLEAVGLAATGRRVEANLSAASIGTLDLLPLLARQLHDTGADPANLIFEITETTLMADIDAGAAFAHGLAELGCRLALDDFGTGFGSFTYLKKLPVNYLKIDIEFIRDLPTNPANLHVVRAIVGLAHAFGLQTIAEGVQNEATMTLLCHEGVDFAQGFHLGRPSPIVADVRLQQPHDRAWQGPVRG